MARAVFYDDNHRRIVQSGMAAIRDALFGEDDAQKASLLLCLDYYLDPYYGCTLPYEGEIFALLQELFFEDVPSEIKEDILQLLGDYCGDFSVLRARLDEVEPEFLPRVEGMLG